MLEGVLTVEVTFWVAVGAVALWYFVIASPVVVEELLEWKERGTIAKSPVWRLLVGLLSQQLYLTICLRLLGGKIRPQTPLPMGSSQRDGS